MARLTVWNPWGILPRDWADDEMYYDSSSSLPQINVYESNDDIVVEVKAPGFNKDSLSIDFEGSRLTISGTDHHVEESDEKDKKYYYKEIRTMSFTRTIDLPVSVKESEAKAVYKDGILKIAIPKSEEAKPRKIEIEVGE
ncbi:MAG TPA: Hsp20/alpha crystallin family protein [Candidatus Dojkabacteria bacterium]|nr:Hsp20/alpha crystallin family protein [Candidatus Dojkabacteria bacterium]HQG57677.1 Hsp20/alpha crystallin family protein [Candidatus Dojkabacteria bacterium]